MEAKGMTKVENKFLNLVNKSFLVIHLGLFFLFTTLGVDLMAGLNMISICFYFITFGLTRTGKPNLYVYLVAGEVLIHMVAATLCVGLECNFQLCLMGMILFFFVMEYVIKGKRSRNYSGIVLGIIYSIVIVALYVLGDSIKPVYDLNPVVKKTLSVGVVTVVLLITIASMIFLTRYLASEEGELTKKAQFDALTELPNRFFMMDELKRIFETGTQKQYYLAMIDIDDFKKINDTYGHNVGDDALKLLSRTIVEKARGTELKYCRWGGEEFLLLGKCVNGEIPKDYLDELRLAINSKTIWTSMGSGKMTVTIGAGKYKVGEDSKEWINFVDKQLYVGKCTGKNKVVC